MFTGIITNFAIIKNLEFDAKKDVLLTLEIKKSDLDRKLKIGCSIACNGICFNFDFTKNCKK